MPVLGNCGTTKIHSVPSVTDEIPREAEWRPSVPEWKRRTRSRRRNVSVKQKSIEILVRAVVYRPRNRRARVFDSNFYVSPGGKRVDAIDWISTSRKYRAGRKLRFPVNGTRVRIFFQRRVRAPTSGRIFRGFILLFP